MRFFQTVLLSLALLLPTVLPAAEQGGKPLSDKMMAAEAIRQYPVLDMLIEDNKDFKPAWLAEFERLKIRKPGKDLQALMLEAGANVAMGKIDPYLEKADDDAAGAYLLVYSDLMFLGARDENICSLFLDGINNKPEPKTLEDAKARQATINDIEQKYFDVLIPKLLTGITGLVLSSRNGTAKVIDEKSQQEIMIEAITLMTEKHGMEALPRMLEMKDESIPKTRRCEVVAWLFEAIGGLPTEKRAMLARMTLGK